MDGMDVAEKVTILPNKALDAARDARDAKSARIEAWRIARSLLVPVDEDEVRASLRMRAHPICYFGEDAHDRRDRLRQLMVVDAMRNNTHAEKLDSEGRGQGGVQTIARHGHDDVDQVRSPPDAAAGYQKQQEDEEDEFYTEGQPALRALRMALALPSIKRARARLARERAYHGSPPHDASGSGSGSGSGTRAHAREAEDAVVRAVRGSYTVASHVGDERPLSAISYAAARHGADARVVTGSWAGRIKVWRGDDSGTLLQCLDLHTARVSNVCFPRGAEDVLLSCAADGVAYLCRRGEHGVFARQAEMREHGGARVCDAKMHPFHRSLLVTAGFDGAFVLLDEGRVVLRQTTGHDRVYRTSFHPDGSLLSTCGLDGGIRVWDLRSGRAVMTMTKAHADDVLGVEFAGDGRVLASCGMDNVLRLWDLRRVSCAKTVAAHRSVISDMRFGGGLSEGDVLFTSSFDRSVKCWGGRRDWGLVAAHTSYEDKVTGLDCCSDGLRIVTACYDKTWKVWGRDS